MDFMYKNLNLHAKTCILTLLKKSCFCVLEFSFPSQVFSTHILLFSMVNLITFQAVISTGWLRISTGWLHTVSIVCPFNKITSPGMKCTVCLFHRQNFIKSSLKPLNFARDLILLILQGMMI